MCGPAVVRPEVRVACPDYSDHERVVVPQEVFDLLGGVAFCSWAAVARCHEDVGVINLFPACDLHCPGVESICYGLGAPGTRGPVVDDRLSDNTSPLACLVLICSGNGDRTRKITYF